MERVKAGMGPFRATRVWNEIVNDFRSGIPSKRHRWKMRFYDDCFLSSEAIDWLHDYLKNNENYGPWVTREQAVQLLDKFVQSKVIESVKPYRGVMKDVFEESGGLYKLVHMSPMKKIRGALHSRSNLKALTPSPRKTRSRAPMRPLSLNVDPTREENQAWDVIKSKLSFGSSKDLKAIGGPSQRRRLSKPGLLKRSRSLGGTDKPLSRSSSFYVSVKDVSSREEEVQAPVSSSEERIEAVWRNCLLTRLRSLLWLFTLEGVVDEGAIRGSHIIHNSTQLSRTGVVVLSDKDHDLPQWVLSAMKCIANWPQKQDSDLPNYSGFEKDVFQTISNYFRNLEKPLMTFDLYNLITQAYDLGRKRDNERMNPQETESMVAAGGPPPPHPEKLSQNKSPSMKDVKRSCSMRQAKHRFRSQERMFCITKCRKEVQPAKSTQRNHEVQASNGGMNCPHSQTDRGTYQFKTRLGRAQSMKVQSASGMGANTSAEGNVFLSSGRPRSFAGYSVEQEFKVMTPPSMHAGDLSKASKGQFQHQQSTESCSDFSHDVTRPTGKFVRHENKRGLRLSKRFGSASDLIGRLVRRKGSRGQINGSMPDIMTTVIQEECEPAHPESLPQGLSPPLTGSSSLQNVSSQSRSARNSQTVSPPYPAPLRATLSVSEIVKSDVDGPISSPFCYQDDHSSISGNRFFLGKSSSAVELRISPPADIGDGKVDVAGAGNPPSLQLESDKSYCEEAMRLALLLLPPPNRRKLHLLMKMMSKMERNDELELGEDDRRELLLQTFSRCILRSFSEVDYDEAYANRIVAYLLDNFDAILAPSVALKLDVDKELSSRPELQSSAASGSSVVFCKQQTKEEYKDDAQNSSQKALEDLLGTIISDQNMGTKEKKKRLKLFNQAYPQIYKKRLPTAASEAKLFAAKPRIKQPMLKKSFTRLKPIR